MPNPSLTEALLFLEGGGEAARMIRERDWTEHPLGSPETWPASLKTALGLVLNSPESMILAWGEDLSFFFNDTYFPLLGPRLSSAMGARFDEVWADGWAQARPIIEEAFAGRSRRFVDLPWKLDTDRGAAETWWSFSYSRVLDEKGRIAGLFIFTNETTERVLAERRQGQAEAALRAEHALATEHAERVQLALGAGAIIGTWVWDLPSDRFTVDEAFARNFGLDPALGHDGLSLEQVVETVHPDDKAGLAQAIAEVISRGGAYAHQYRVRRADGRYYWIEANGRVDHAPDGTPLRFPGVLIDVDGRRAVEAERDRATALLREKAVEFETLADNIPTLCWMARADGHIYWYNRRWYDYTGADFETLRGWGWQASVEPGALPSMLARWHRSVESGEPFEMTFPMRGADGVYRPFLTRIVPIRDEDGRIGRWFGTNTDITGQLAAENALRELNETLADQIAARTAERDRLWQTSNDLLCVASFGGTFVSLNPAWTTVLGWAEGELKARPFLDFVHPDDRERTAGVAAALAAGAPQIGFENRFRAKDGAFRWFSWSAVPEAGLIYASVRDVTELKEQARTLALTEEALRQAQKMEAVGQLTGGIAHDFNNLLAGIAGSLEILSARIEQSRFDGLDRYIAGAQGAAKRAAALTHRLLAFSRRQTLDPKPTDVGRLVTGMEDLVRRTVGPGIAVEVVTADDLWATLVDQNQLENALLNLCINARDAMPDGGRITIETENARLDAREAGEMGIPPGEYISLCVIDNGTGMAPEVIDKAFEPFFTTKPLGVGTGLGLSMIYGFTRQSGGGAHIRSELGKGTRICIHLPRFHGAAEDGESVPASHDAPRAENGETVLVVDDEPLIRMLILDVLEDLGYAALEAEDGASGLAILESGARIDLLVSDIGLPGGMNGRQMAEAARRARPDLKVLFVTGYAEGSVLGNERLGAGMHVVTKPFAMEDLANRIRTLISEA